MTKKHQVSIVAIFRNEHRYIVEWLEYHIKVGVDHFYLYDNGGDHKEILESFMEHITYVLWTDDIAEKHMEGTTFSRQTMAYTDCVGMYGKETEWLQLIDLDEYLVPLEGQDVKSYVRKYEQDDLSKLRIPRFNFGNNGRWKFSNKGSIASYLRRERWSSHHKDMGRSETIKKVNGPHSFRVKGQTWIPDNLRIHHHYTRSLSEWMRRAKTGGGNGDVGFRVFIGRSKWLAYLAFFALNTRSIWSLFFLAGFNLSMLFTSTLPIWVWLINLPFIGFLIFSYRIGQNEVKDDRLIELVR